MHTLKIVKDPRVADKFAASPTAVRVKLDHLRSLIIETASENDGIEELEETLKWSEPSYLAKKGSTIRMDWKPKTPNQYALYFKCTSKLVSTFREVYGDTFTYEGNRAILFGFDEKIPKDELKSCIRLALNYHSLKNLPRLGI